MKAQIEFKSGEVIEGDLFIDRIPAPPPPTPTHDKPDYYMWKFYKTGDAVLHFLRLPRSRSDGIFLSEQEAITDFKRFGSITANNKGEE